MSEAETAEVKLSAHTKLSNLDAGWANAAELQRVWLWDIGPEKPRPPQRPPLPKGKEGDPAFDLEKIEFKDALEVYEASLKHHAVLKAQYSDWERKCGGPIEIPFWSVDAEHALAADERAVREGRQSRRRWYISSRTRGKSKLPNRGLPEGMKPGHGQAAIERQIREDGIDMAAARRSDPIFGEASWAQQT
jgi:hypothetical protein